MINKIKMSRVRSFTSDKEVRISTDNRINFFYGLNGTGKSTISEFLQEPKREEFQQCSVDTEGSRQPDIRVYNQKFIEDIFYEKDEVKGIFSLGKGNKEAKKKIERAEGKIQNIEGEIENIEEQVSKVESEIDDDYSDLLDEVWKSLTDHKDTVLDFCLVGYKNDKEKYFRKVDETNYEDIGYDFQDLTEEAEELLGEESKRKEELSQVDYVFGKIESDDILSQAIVGTRDSYLAELIIHLGNSDWVKDGQGYLGETDDTCPFCQQKLKEDFKSELEKFFDRSYKKKINYIESIKNNYTELIKSLKSKLDSTEFQQDYAVESEEFNKIKDDLIKVLEQNRRKLEKKKEEPSEKFELDSTERYIRRLNDSISDINEKIRGYNKKIDDLDNFKSTVQNKYWKVVRKQYQESIELFKKKSKRLNEQFKECERNIGKLDEKISSSEKTIADNRDDITNIQNAIDSINDRIKALGMTGFEIIKMQEDQNYKISRDDREEEVFKSLSEGEKTLITFFYFLEYCKGSHQNDAPLDVNNRIVVVDDPISSLSHNYVYEIASLIHHELIEDEYAQVFLLTHNLFFFHEMLQLGRERQYNLFRLTKNESSRINKMERDEIKNEYESYWQAVKDVKAGVSSEVILPNMMRNILETYFSFIHQEDRLKRAINELEDKYTKFKPLYRYINRESHADAINITDFGDMDAQRFIERFKEIFYETGFEDHFHKMMGDSDM